MVQGDGERDGEGEIDGGREMDCDKVCFLSRVKDT